MSECLSTERLKRLKRASRLIVNTREKMPHSAQWHLSLRRTLWRYTKEVLLGESSPPTQPLSDSEEQMHDR
jgi:hypothetical protein